MAETPNPTQELMTLQVDTEWVEKTRCRNFVRDFPALVVDEAEDFGGTNQGPNPMELILAGLNSCETIVMTLTAQEMGLTFQGVDVHSEGDLDPRGLSGEPGIKPYFQTVRQTVSLRADWSDDQIATVREATESHCPAFNLLRDAGVVMKVEWKRL